MEAGSEAGAKAAALRTRGKACLRRFETVERSGDDLNWRSQPPKPAVLSLKAAFRDSAAVEGSRAARRFLLNYWPSSFDKTAHFGHFLQKLAVSTPD
jgi:hypothetical protein